MQVLHFLSHKNDGFFPSYASLNIHLGLFPPTVKTGDPVPPLSICKNHFIKIFNKNKIYHIVSGRLRLPQLLNLSKYRIIDILFLVSHKDIRYLPTVVICLDHTSIMKTKTMRKKSEISAECKIKAKDYSVLKCYSVTERMLMKAQQ